MKKIMIAMVMLLSVSAAYAGGRESKVIADDAVIIDHNTNLMWARYGREKGCSYGETKVWSDAVAYCNNLDFALRQDWRLPSKAELLSINDDKTHSALIAPYWSSTDDGDGFAWEVLFRSNYVSLWIQSARNYVRCVRTNS